MQYKYVYRYALRLLFTTGLSLFTLIVYSTFTVELLFCTVAIEEKD